MDKQILFHFLLTQNIYEVGNKIPRYQNFVDLNGYVVPEKDIEEFNQELLLDRR